MKRTTVEEFDAAGRLKRRTVTEEEEDAVPYFQYPDVIMRPFIVPSQYTLWYPVITRGTGDN